MRAEAVVIETNKDGGRQLVGIWTCSRRVFLPTRREGGCNNEGTQLLLLTCSRFREIRSCSGSTFR